MSTPEPTKVDAFTLPDPSDNDAEVARMIGEGGRDDNYDTRDITPVTQPRSAIAQVEGRHAPTTIMQPRAAILQTQPRTGTYARRPGSSKGFDPFRTDDPDDEGKGID